MLGYRIQGEYNSRLHKQSPPSWTKKNQINKFTHEGGFCLYSRVSLTGAGGIFLIAGALFLMIMIDLFIIFRSFQGLVPMWKSVIFVDGVFVGF